MNSPAGTVWTRQSTDPDLYQMRVGGRAVSSILTSHAVALTSDAMIAELARLGVRYRIVSPATFPYESGCFHVLFQAPGKKGEQIVHPSLRCALGYAVARCIQGGNPGPDDYAPLALVLADHEDEDIAAAKHAAHQHPESFDVTGAVSIDDVPL